VPFLQVVLDRIRSDTRGNGSGYVGGQRDRGVGGGGKSRVRRSARAQQQKIELKGREAARKGPSCDFGHSSDPKRV